jgi:hypothetical protein
MEQENLNAKYDLNLLKKGLWFYCSAHPLNIIKKALIF